MSLRLIYRAVLSSVRLSASSLISWLAGERRRLVEGHSLPSSDATWLSIRACLSAQSLSWTARQRCHCPSITVLQWR